MLNRFRQTRYFVPLLLVSNLVFALCIMHFGHPYYETNDDFSISSFFVGLFGTATANGIFVNVLLGAVLKLAFGLCPGIDWFWAAMVGVTMLSFTCFGWALLRVAGWRGLFPYLFILFMYGYRFYIVWNFTRTAALASAVGFAVAVLLLRTPDCKLASFVPCILLVWFGLLLRWHSGALATALAMPVLAVLALPPLMCAARTKDAAFFSCHRPKFAAAAVLTLVVLLGVLAQEIADNANRQHSDYTAYNTARAEVLDYPIADYENHAAEYAAIGVTQEDLSLIKAWTFADYERITTDTFRDIRAIEVERLPQKIELEYEAEVIQELLTKRNLVALTVVILAACLVLNRRLSLVATATLTASAALMYFVLVSGNRYPQRVLDGLDITFALLLVAVQPWTCSREKTMRQNRVKWQLFVSLAAAVAFTALLEGEELCRPELWKERGMSQTQMENDRVELAQKLNPDILYLRDSASRANYGALYPLGKMPPAGTEHNLLNLGGWEVQSPPYNEVLSDYGVKNPFRALAEQDNVMLLDYGVNHVRLKQEYLRCYYDPTLHWSVVDTVLGQPMVAFTALPQDLILLEASNAPLTVSATKQVGEEGMCILAGTLQDMPEDYSVCSLLLQEEDGTKHCFRFLPQQDGNTFTFIVPTELLPDGSYTVEALCKTQGSAEYNWRGQATTLVVDTESA